MEVREDVVAYSQIIEILQYISDSDYYKIPKKERDFYFEHSDPKYYFNYDPSKSLEENDVSDKTKKILAYLFKEYWATESQKEKIESYNRVYYAKIEGEKKQKYSVDNIFDYSNWKSTLEDYIAEKWQLLDKNDGILNYYHAHQSQRILVKLYKCLLAEFESHQECQKQNPVFPYT